MTAPKLFTRLVADDAAAALDFYAAALGATELVRYEDPSGKIVHAEFQLGDDIVSVTEADGSVNRSPADLGGSGVLLTLVVADADAVGAAMEGAGATAVIPIADQFYGRREGRLRDPFGHLWIISQDGDDLDPSEIQRRVDAESAG
ncbi:MAG: VOC family protein [Actinomycetota bacterium]